MATHEANGERIPGTSLVIDQGNDSGLVHNNSGSSIILHPQPSNDPNDPLNWTRLRKEFHYALVWIWAFILAVSVHWNGPVYQIMARYYDASLNQMNISSALCYLFLGVGCVVLQPLALKFGRRPVYLVGTLLNIFGNALCGGLNTLGSLYACNIITGLAAAPVDSLVQISITDIFFLHEHGRRLSIYLFALYAGSYLGPVAAGYIYEGQGDWKWIVWWLVIISGGLLILQLFSMDETLYHRKQMTPECSDKENEYDGDLERKIPSHAISVTSIVENLEGNCQVPKTYWQRMKLIESDHGSKSSYLKLFWMPFTTLRYPAVIWCSTVYGVQICWLSYLALTQSEFFEESPYNFSADSAGLTNLASLIGGFLGMLYGSWSDWFQLWLTRRNEGIFEPEFRLWTMIGSGLINTAGLLMYGLGINYGVQWMFPVVGVALISFGISASGAIAITYAVDCYPEQTGQTMVVILLIRNLLGTLFTFVFQYWLDGMGNRDTTIFLSVICLAASFSFLCFAQWGKYFRRKTGPWYFKAIEIPS